jgi:hypothetical protein
MGIIHNAAFFAVQINSAAVFAGAAVAAYWSDLTDRTIEKL